MGLTAPRRRALRWQGAAAALLAVLGLAGCGDPPTGAAPGIAQPLRDATLIEAGRERRVVLPDSWESSAPARDGTVRYRVDLPDAALQQAQSALFVPRVGNVFRIEINGQQLLAAGTRSRDSGRVLSDAPTGPVLLALPGALLGPSGNEAVIEVSGQPRRDAGLSIVWVGPIAELEPMHRRFYDHEVRGAWVVGACAAVMGLLALLLAWRARRFVYACFGAGSLLWAWRTAGLQLAADSPWAPLGTVLYHASYAWFVVLMTLYALAAVERDTPRLRRWLAAWALAAFGLAIGVWVFNAPALRTALLGGTLAIAVGLLPVLLHTAWRDRTSAALLLSAAALVSAAVGARDFWVFRVLADYGNWAWSRYTILLLLMVLAWLLVDEFARAGAALRSLNRDLQDRVAQKERELQAAFEDTRVRERQQAVLAERDRILREMHDGLGGRLVAALALTDQVTRQSAAPDGGAPRSVDEPLRDLKLTLDDCLVELRLALDSLETDTRPLVESLAELRFRVEPSLRAAGVRLVWQVDDAASETALPAAATLHVLRIVREALTNVIKHAQATVVWLRLEALADGGLVLAVVDNGLKQRAGETEPLPLFVPATLQRGGRGLANMERRAKALSAHLDSGPHAEGWAVTLVLPVQALAAAAP